MKHVVRNALMGLVLASALSLSAGETVAATELAPVVSVVMAPVSAATPAAVTASAGEIWCYYCGRYEGSAFNPSTMQWEPVVYAYCEDYPRDDSIDQGAWLCYEPPNAWNFEYEWEGDVCEMYPHNPTSPPHPCDCRWPGLLNWPQDPLTLDNCEPIDSPLLIAADGFIARAQTLDVDRGAPLEQQTTCNGIVTGVVVSADRAAGRARASNLTI